jgi:C4-dicarboxylate-specific signal transduction histidine kinase
MSMSQYNALWKADQATISKYGIAVLSVTVALIFALLMQTYLHTELFSSSFLCAIMFAAWFGGAGPDLLAAVLAVLAFMYYAAAPTHSFHVAPTEIPRVVVFVSATLFVVWISAAQRAATNSLRRAHDNLQATMQKLERINRALQSENAERERVEKQLRRSEAYLAEAQRLSHTGSFGRGVASGDIVWSKEMYQIFEIDQAVKPRIDLILERVHPDDREFVRRKFDNAARGKQDRDYEYRLMMPNGMVKHLHVRAHRVKYELGEEEVIGVLMDVTAAKEAEEALQTVQAELVRVTRLTMTGELLASIAHEIHQPLAAVAISGSAGLRWLNRDQPDLAAAREALSRIVRDAHRAGNVIHGLRALAQKSGPQLTELDINDAIHEVLALSRSDLHQHGVLLHTTLSADVQPVFGDRIQLQQVLLNLITNAVDAMSVVMDRPKVLTITSACVEPGGMLVAVGDTGAGFDPAMADRIFTPFVTTKPNGMGMGLSICRSIIEAHGGRLWVSPGVPCGTVFRFTVPGVASS